jgi:transposase
MTTTESSSQILKTDALARVRTPPERRQQLLDEFERSGLSGVKFAALVGLKYSTLAGWAAKRRRQGPAGPRATPPTKSPAQVRWVEAVLDQTQGRPGRNFPVLTVQLHGGARLEIGHVDQVELAAALLRALEKPTASC